MSHRYSYSETITEGSDTEPAPTLRLSTSNTSPNQTSQDEPRPLQDQALPFATTYSHMLLGSRAPMDTVSSVGRDPAGAGAAAGSEPSPNFRGENMDDSKMHPTASVKQEVKQEVVQTIKEEEVKQEVVQTHEREVKPERPQQGLQQVKEETSKHLPSFRTQVRQPFGPHTPAHEPMDTTPAATSSFPQQRVQEKAPQPKPEKKCEINVFVRDLHGKTLTILISPDALIHDLKAKASAKCRVNTNDFWLEYSRSHLEEGYSLSYYNIRNESTVHMMGRLRGGY